MLDLENITNEVCRIAKDAGRFLREECGRFRRECVEHKGAHDYVSYVDKESERRIVEQLHALLPEAGFIAEEGSAGMSDETYCWVVDPLMVRQISFMEMLLIVSASLYGIRRNYWSESFMKCAAMNVTGHGKEQWRV